jgi:NAD(P)-dependent dehydrogenase (short-subunit alcohol dehydrogenase family)
MTSPSYQPLALVTGASTGIGRALAEAFTDRGYDVVVAADEPETNAVAKDISSTGRAAFPRQPRHS